MKEMLDQQCSDHKIGTTCCQKLPVQESLIECLNSLSKSKTSYILITKDGSEHPVNFLVSSGFTESQLQQIKSIIENPSDCLKSSNLCQIKPALKIVYPLELSRKTTEHLMSHYADLLTSLSQAICKEVAKQWIKVAEPNKQALYPYKYYNESKPPWWPSTVNHIEPDHLDKSGRIKVLINILRSPEFDLLSLRARTSVLNFKNLVAYNILDELYYLSAYDRLFFDQLREENPLYSNLSSEAKESFSSHSIKIMVSDVRACRISQKKSGVVMISQIKPELISSKVYEVNQDTTLFKNLNTTSQSNINHSVFLREFQGDENLFTEDTTHLSLSKSREQLLLEPSVSSSLFESLPPKNVSSENGMNDSPRKRKNARTSLIEKAEKKPKTGHSIHKLADEITTSTQDPNYGYYGDSKRNLSIKESKTTVGVSSNHFTYMSDASTESSEECNTSLSSNFDESDFFNFGDADHGLELQSEIFSCSSQSSDQ
ncbi:uncharacterized protein PRCAT00001092001 [Priceomyces carsonii]|uniref:uncharacterized protein n=1 Tax=Priceomyces carsonii TaxID=28549 RepID=UPI002EDB1CE0|nr:unnamed protein product [Priceomyces carsonii]